MPISALDLFKIGIGPSSSHTVGPMRAAHAFVQELAQLPAHLPQVGRIKVQLYGSLSATGVGHGTDNACIMGLLGERPELVDPDAVLPAIESLKSSGILMLDSAHAVPFEWLRDMRFEPIALPYHPNAMRITAYKKGSSSDSAQQEVLYRNTYYSIGGGFILTEAQALAGAVPANEVDVPLPFDTGADLLRQCRAQGISISALMLTNETAWRPEEQTRASLLEIWQAMDACMDRGMQQTGILPGGLNVKRRAAALYHDLVQRQRKGNLISLTLGAMDWVNLYALAVNEENAGGGRVVTAPTNGAAGIVPAVLKYYMQFHPSASDNDAVRFLLAASAVGSLLKRNASISGAEVGCQGEVGSACAMAAAGLTEVMGGTPEQVENAAEIGLEHNLGLTCDPIGGLVQIPCIERNAMGSIKAINAAQLALRGNGVHMVSLDQAIRTMRDTGKDMMDKYKETSRGGLAVSFTEC